MHACKLFVRNPFKYILWCLKFRDQKVYPNISCITSLKENKEKIENVNKFAFYGKSQQGVHGLEVHYRMIIRDIFNYDLKIVSWIKSIIKFN